MKLSVVKRENTFYLKGVITNLEDFKVLLELDSPEIILNFKEVRRINSFGTGVLNRLLSQLGKNSKMIFEECPPSIVYQLAYNYKVMPNFEVKSVYAPYYCEDCGNEESVFVKISELDPENPQLKDRPCTCGSSLEFDDVPEIYFLFLTYMKKAGKV